MYLVGGKAFGVIEYNVRFLPVVIFTFVTDTAAKVLAASIQRREWRRLRRCWSRTRMGTPSSALLETAPMARSDDQNDERRVDNGVAECPRWDRAGRGMSTIIGLTRYAPPRLGVLCKGVNVVVAESREECLEWTCGTMTHGNDAVQSLWRTRRPSSSLTCVSNTAPSFNTCTVSKFCHSQHRCLRQPSKLSHHRDRVPLVPAPRPQSGVFMARALPARVIRVRYPPT